MTVNNNVQKVAKYSVKLDLSPQLEAVKRVKLALPKLLEDMKLLGLELSLK
jgi:hypothetical protein